MYVEVGESSGVRQEKLGWKGDTSKSLFTGQKELIDDDAIEAEIKDGKGNNADNDNRDANERAMIATFPLSGNGAGRRDEDQRKR